MAYVSVLIKGTTMGALSDSAGDFRIVHVPVGNYRVVTRMIGFASSERSGVQVSADQTTHVDFTLTTVLVRFSPREVRTTRKPLAVVDERVAPTRGDFEVDSVALFGAWRWVQTYGGQLGANYTPPPSGWSRVLYLRRDGTYAFWERDSVRDTPRCADTFAVHPSGGHLEDGPPASLWIELKGWCPASYARQLVAFLGRDTIMTYPGGGGMVVSGASMDTYVRDVGRCEPKTSGTDVPFLTTLPEDFPSESEFVHYEEAAVPITRAQPGYPEFAREAGIRGEVLLHVLVGRDGRVKDVKVLRGVTGLNESAIQAARNWVFRPALSNNKPVAVWIEVPFHFPP